LNLNKKLRYLIRILPQKEKIFFLVLAAVFLISLAGIIKQAASLVLADAPADGGEISEGIIGTPRFINPALATSDADRDLTILIYSGLLRRDGQGNLIPDLAEDYKISEDGLSYAFKIRDEAVWHDNKPITSDDVVFTIKTIQNSLIKSPKQASWEGVEIQKISDKEISFSLKRPYAPFLENAALGILPKHIWEKIPPEQFSLNVFNIKPVGSGPFKIKETKKDSSDITTAYILERNKKFTLGKPHLKKIILKFYPSEEALIKAFKNKEIDSLAAASPKNLSDLKRKNSIVKTLKLPWVFGVFFNQNQNPILANQEVREALDLASDKDMIIQEVLGGFGERLASAIPPGVLGYFDFDFDLKNRPASETSAKEKLEKAGWKYNQEEKIYEKKNKKETLQLKFSLATSNAPDLAQAANMLKTNWEKIGVKTDVQIFEIGNLNQNVIRPRKYDALLFGLIVGGDPDPFAFWHSSQRNDPGLNISLYANITVDRLLEEARTTLNPKARELKYQAFQKELIEDKPAIFLYSPTYIYLIPKSLKGMETENITVPSERFAQIHQWHVKTKKIWKRLPKG